MLSGTNTHDLVLLEQALDAMAVERPSTEAGPQHLCADAAYVGGIAEYQMRKRHYTPHVHSRREESRHKAVKQRVQFSIWAEKQRNGKLLQTYV